jgi:hypothetical protein
MSKKPPRVCAYCGRNKGSTRDHVVPKCLFPKPRPSILVTVPACDRCIGAKAKDEDYLRDMLVLNMDCENHPAAQQLLQGQVSRSIRTNRSLLGRAVRTQSSIQPRQTVGGEYLGHFPSVPLEATRVVRAFTRITRGLYFYRQTNRIPDTYNFVVERIEHLHADKAITDFRSQGCNGPFVLGQNVFACFYVIGLEDPFVTLWLQNYYNVLIKVATAPPGFDWNDLDRLKAD